MIEPLYGSTSTIWPGVPSAGYPWPMPFVNRPLTAGQATLTSPSSGLSGGFPRIGSPGPLPIAPEPYPSSLASMASLASLMPPEISPHLLVAGLAARRGQPLGPTTDQEIEDFIYDALELFPGTSEVEVRSENGRATLTGSVHHKRLKRDLGEILWAIPGVADVQNNLTIATRRRAARGGGAREGEPQQAAGGPARKTA